MSKKGGTVCVVRNCSSKTTTKDTVMFRFPKDAERANRWLIACNRQDLMNKTLIQLCNNYKICALHFDGTAFTNHLQNRLLPSANPTIFPNKQNPSFFGGHVPPGSSLAKRPRKMHVRYKDSLPGTNTQEFASKVSRLKKEIESLDEYEQELDQHRLWIEQSIKNTTEDIETKRYLYVTSDDLEKYFNNDTNVFILNTPMKTDVKYSSPCSDIHHLRIQSPASPITANLLTEYVDGASKCRKRHYPKDSKIEPSEPLLKKKLVHSEEDSDLIAAEILFRKASSDVTDILNKDDCEGISPFIRLSPLSLHQDYCFGLSESEGACDLFDIFDDTSTSADESEEQS